MPDRDGISDPNDVDWQITAAALADRVTDPAALVDRQCRILLVNGAFENLLGRARRDLSGRPFAATITLGDEAASALGAQLEHALASAAPGIDCVARIAGGGATLRLELTPVATGALLVVRDVRRHLADEAQPVRHFAYEIAVTPHEFGYLQTIDDEPLPAPHDRRCYEELYQRSGPCVGCPALAPDDAGRTAVIAPDRHDRAFAIVTAGPPAAGTRRMEAWVLAPKIAVDLGRARVAALAESAALSPREREILELLLLGRDYDDITRVLGISQRTVKFHQTKLLEKLGAETRLDLFRVLF